MMNTRCSKHVEDNKNWIKTLILRAHFVGLPYLIVQKYTVLKNKYDSMSIIGVRTFLHRQNMKFEFIDLKYNAPSSFHIYL
jgi:hypothetical protein